VLRRFLAFSEAASREAGIKPQQHQALLAIKAWPGAGMPIKNLADQLQLRHNGAVQLADRLAKAGLAERRPSPSDGRSVQLHLTAKGEALVADLAERHLDELLACEPLLAESLGRLRHLETSRGPAPD
jgi:DNA-binding MarR family transcriptional regulator